MPVRCSASVVFEWPHGRMVSLAPLTTNMLERRSWVPSACEDLVQSIAAQTARADSASLAQTVFELVAQNKRIHELHGINLNPASNVMNPRAEALMAAGLGPRASLGYPGDKVEMGLDAIERIEVIAAELACEVFDARYAELRVGSGALANLYVSWPLAAVATPSSRRRATSAGMSRTMRKAPPVCTA
jgi:Serine hydroxymethyltransferase